MFTDEARAFLQKPLIARLATFGPDGYPHVVPLWFKLEGDEIIIISERKTRKIENLKVNPRASVEVGGEPDDPLGYLIRGDVTVADDTDHNWTNRLTYHYESKEHAERDIAAWASLDMVVLRLKPVSVVKVWSA